MVKILIDPKFHYHPSYKTIYAKVLEASKKFPEVKELIISAFHPKNTSDAAAYAGSAGKIPKIEFNIKRNPTTNIIYHEFYHLLQKTPPKGKMFSETQEIDATLLGQARMNKNCPDDNTMPYFKAVPKDKLVAYAKYAAREKAKGNKNYIIDTYLKTEADKKKDPKNKGWTSPSMSSKPVATKFTVNVGGKKYAKGHTPNDILKNLKKNIKPEEQREDMLNHYAYEIVDLIKKPAWTKPKTKSIKIKTKKTQAPKPATRTKKR
jgi:hypothetical protein